MNKQSNDSKTNRQKSAKQVPRIKDSPRAEELSEMSFVKDIENKDKHFMTNLLMDSQFDLRVKNPKFDLYFEETKFFFRFLNTAKYIFKTPSEIYTLKTNFMKWIEPSYERFYSIYKSSVDLIIFLLKDSSSTHVVRLFIWMSISKSKSIFYIMKTQIGDPVALLHFDDFNFMMSKSLFKDFRRNKANALSREYMEYRYFEKPSVIFVKKLPKEVAIPQPQIPSKESKALYYDYRYGWNNCELRPIPSECGNIDKSLSEVFILQNSQIEILNRTQMMIQLIDSSYILEKEEFLRTVNLKVSSLSPSLYFTNTNETNLAFRASFCTDLFERIVEMKDYAHELIPSTIFYFEIDSILFTIFNECLDKETISNSVDYPFDQIFTGSSINIKIHFIFIEYLILFLKESSFQMAKERILKNLMALNKSICNGVIPNFDIECLFIHFISLRALVSRAFLPILVIGLYEKVLSDLKSDLINNPKTNLEVAMYCVISDNSLNGMSSNKRRFRAYKNSRCFTTKKSSELIKNIKNLFYEYLKKYFRDKKTISSSYLDSLTRIVNENFITSYQKKDRIVINKSHNYENPTLERDKPLCYKLLILMFRENPQYYLDLIRIGIIQRKIDILQVSFAYHIENSKFWRFQKNELFNSFFTLDLASDFFRTLKELSESEVDLTCNFFRNITELTEGSVDFTITGSPQEMIVLPFQRGVGYILEWLFSWLDRNAVSISFENLEIICDLTVHKDFLDKKFVYEAVKLVGVEYRQRAAEFLVRLLLDGIFQSPISNIAKTLISVYGQLKLLAIDNNTLIKSLDNVQISNDENENNSTIVHLKRIHETKSIDIPDNSMFIILENNLKSCLDHRLKQDLSEYSNLLFVLESLYPKLNERFETPFRSVEIKKARPSNITKNVKIISKFSIGRINETRRLFEGVHSSKFNKERLKNTFRLRKVVSRYLKNEFHNVSLLVGKCQTLLISETLKGLFNIDDLNLYFNDYSLHKSKLRNSYKTDYNYLTKYVEEILRKGYNESYKTNPKIKSPISTKNIKSFTGSTFPMPRLKRDYFLTEAILRLDMWSTSSLNFLFRTSRNSRDAILSREVLIGNRELGLISRLGTKLVNIRTKNGLIKLVSIKFKFIE
jgi:hypothetical protein